MPRMPMPWFRKDREVWYVQIRGKQYNLGADREAAFRQYHELLAKPPEPQKPSAGSVVAVVDAFLDWCQSHRSQATYEWYRKHTQSFVDTIASSLTTAELKPYHVERWIASHPQWAAGTRRGAMLAVQRAFNWAVKMGHADRNPVAHLEKPSAGRRELVIRPADYERLLTLIVDSSFRDLVVAAWETGARPQELLRVESRHVDLANARWVFPQTEAKGKRRVRVVYLTEVALGITKRLMLKQPEGPLFRNAQGKPWHPFAVNCRFSRLKKKIGMKLCLYTFRHSFATRLLESGVDAMTVATLLGHADASMLGRVYQHLAQNPQHLLAQLRRTSA